MHLMMIVVIEIVVDALKRVVDFIVQIIFLVLIKHHSKNTTLLDMTIYSTVWKKFEAHATFWGHVTHVLKNKQSSKRVKLLKLSENCIGNLKECAIRRA